jgi:hypothetical protein
MRPSFSRRHLWIIVLVVALALLALLLPRPAHAAVLQKDALAACAQEQSIPRPGNDAAGASISSRV